MKKRIVCYGDSNTWGYDAITDGRFPDEVRWTGKLQEKLGAEYTVIEEDCVEERQFLKIR